MARLKKVLFVAYQFPMRSRFGVHRGQNFMKQLPDLGYLLFVLTVTEENINKGEFNEMES